MGSILSRMEEGGLILRRQKAGNRRSLYVSLTEKGREDAQRVETAFRAVEEEAAGELSPAEQQTLQELLSRLYANLQSNSQKEKESS